MMIEAFKTPDLTPQNIIASVNCIIPVTAHKYLQPKQSQKYARDPSMVIKSLTLLGLISKYQKSNIISNKGASFPSISTVLNEDKQFDPKKYYLDKWYAKTKSVEILPGVMDRILVQQSINNQGTFLYRIKSYCRNVNISNINRGQQQQQEQQQKCQQKDEQQKELDQEDKQDQKYIQNNQKQTQNLTDKANNNKITKQNRNQYQNQCYNDKINKQMENNRQHTTNIDKNNSKQSQTPTKNQNSIPNSNTNTIKCHLRHISQQPSLPLSSEQDDSNDDILETLDQKLSNLHTRILVAGLRSCQIMINKISQRTKRQAFKLILF